MSSALWIGTTGLSASEKQMDVIGNNLANVNTVGFKAADAYFSSMLSQNLAGSGGQEVGQGVSVAAINNIFAQGTFASTGNATDLAVDGNGFFIINGKEGKTLFTRAGSFHVNKDGLLSDPSNYQVQGHMFDQDGIIESQSLTDLNLRSAQSLPRATTYFSVGVTLDSGTATGGTFNSSQTVYDSRGAKHDMNVNFAKMEDTSYWATQTSLDGTNADSQNYYGVHFNGQGTIDKVYASAFTAPPTITAAGGGTATSVINNVGNLYKSTDFVNDPVAFPNGHITVTRGANANTWAITDNGGYANMSLSLGTTDADDTVGVDLDGIGGPDISFNLSGTWANNDKIQFDITQTESDPVNITTRFYGVGSALRDGSTIGNIGDVTWNLVGMTGHDAPAIRSYATTSRIASLENDGYAPGILSGLSVDVNGVVEGSFSNGQSQRLARILLADFPDLEGLNRIGNYFSETAASGAAVKNNPGSGGLGSLQSNSLEISNTDTAKEFIKMIAAQRAYQSSARVITTADQILQELMNIKR